MQQEGHSFLKVFLEDISKGQESSKIEFVNYIDHETIPQDLSYSATCVLTSDSLVEDFESVQVPCDCIDSCGLECPCFSTANAFLDGKLSPFYNHITGKPIIECCDHCACNEHCPNRIVQNGVPWPLQVFKTEHRGFGVRNAALNIPRYSFVCEYAGEIIDSTETVRRMQNKSNDQSNYIYVLKEYGADEDFTQTIVDPTLIGNVGRYLNHSCLPNLMSVPVRSSSMIPRICFFALDDISPYEELTYNYGGFNLNTSSVNNFQKTGCAKKCLCNAPNCSGFLPFLGDDWLH